MSSAKPLARRRGCRRPTRHDASQVDRRHGQLRGPREVQEVGDNLRRARRSRRGCPRRTGCRLGGSARDRSAARSRGWWPGRSGTRAPGRRSARRGARACPSAAAALRGPSTVGQVGEQADGAAVRRRLVEQRRTVTPRCVTRRAGRRAQRRRTIGCRRAGTPRRRPRARTAPSRSRTVAVSASSHSPSRRRPDGFRIQRPSRSDDQESGREARDDLAAEALRGLGPCRHRALLRFQPRDGLLERGREHRRLAARVAIRRSRHGPRPRIAGRRTPRAPTRPPTSAVSPRNV